MSDRSKVDPRLRVAFNAPKRPRDPGPLYWGLATSLAAVLIGPAPFFWAPPVWVAMLLARRPREA